jgi:hypothetical protein
MKSQIALLGIGLAIAAGVAYVELKPADKVAIAPVVATPTASSPTKVVTEVKKPVPKGTPVPMVSKPTISVGGHDDEEDEEDHRDGEDEHDEEDDD